MKKHEFLSQLRSALENNLDGQSLKENMDFYEEYIRNEMKKGIPEEEVISSLGDPWAIAKTVMLSEGMSGSENHNPNESKENESFSTMKTFRLDSNWKVWVLIAVVVLLLLSLIPVAFGVLMLIIRYAFPILLVVAIIQFFKRKQ